MGFLIYSFIFSLLLCFTLKCPYKNSLQIFLILHEIVRTFYFWLDVVLSQILMMLTQLELLLYICIDAGRQLLGDSGGDIFLSWQPLNANWSFVATTSCSWYPNGFAWFVCLNIFWGRLLLLPAQYSTSFHHIGDVFAKNHFQSDFFYIILMGDDSRQNFSNL